MHPYLTEALAAQHRDDLLRTARRRNRIAEITASPVGRRRWRHLAAVLAGHVHRPAPVSRHGTPRRSPATAEAHGPASVVDLTRSAERRNPAGVHTQVACPSLPKDRTTAATR